MAMMKRSFALLCGSVLLLSTLAGCAHSAAPVGQNNRTSATTTTTANSTTTTARTRGTAVPESDTVLGTAMEQQIKEDFVWWQKGDGDSGYTDPVDYIVEHLRICDYMGIYHNYIAVCIYRGNYKFEI